MFDLRASRHELGLTQHKLAAELKMGTWGWQSISKWETAGDAPGPVQVAVEGLLTAHRCYARARRAEKDG